MFNKKPASEYLYKSLRIPLSSFYISFFIFFTIFTFFINYNYSYSQATNTYTLLQPLNNGATTSYTIKDGGLSTYIADITRYFFIIVAIIAAFYLIYGGIQYLTTDMSSLKLEGKETIKRVIVGLIFIFSIWTIFNAINPDLLRSGPDFAAVEAGNANPNATPTLPPSNTSGVGQAPGTVPPRPRGSCVTASSVNGIPVCSTIKSDLENMLNDASKAGIILKLGSGLRTPERQIQLRTQNCGPSEYDIYKKPSRDCNPPTALPGTSNHEGGEAVDFSNMCYSTSPSRSSCTSPAYKWLVDNASKYNFRNSTVEPWHWSRTGY